MLQRNEIKWHEFSNDTIKKATDENKPLFIYITYHSCKVCEDMDHDVFEDERSIKILNEKYIAIKVDKDKRADIDKYFQKAHTLMNKTQGGWPLCIFATPNAKPFFSKTYMLLESKSGSIEDIGFLELSQTISEKISNNDTATLKNANEIDEFLKDEKHPTQATKLSLDFTKNYMHQVKQNYQTKYGGFSKPPIFPQANTLNTLMAIEYLTNDKAADAMITTTLDNMAKSCIENKGIARYFTNDDWSSFNDDKTLYDNALLCQTFVNAYLKYQKEDYLLSSIMCAEFCLDTKSDITVQKAMMVNSLFTLSTIKNKYQKTAIKKMDKLIKKDLNNLEEFAFISSALVKAYKITKDAVYL
jgi:uncharacterized protein YyaL (SSP411 family)